MRELSRLYAILDTDVCAARQWDPRALAEVYLAGGVRLLQLRAKHLASGAFLDLAAEVTALARAADARLIVNDRADIAALSGAAGVHVGQDDLAVEDVRRIVAPEAIVGLSTHNLAQVHDALARPINYVAVGPIFGTQTKDTGYTAVGLDMVRDAQALAAPRGIPVVAIGGITLDTVGDVWEAGAASAAIITDLLVGDPAARVAQFARRAADFEARRG